MKNVLGKKGRVLALALACAMMLGAASCSKGGSDDSEKEDKKTTSGKSGDDDEKSLWGETTEGTTKDDDSLWGETEATYSEAGDIGGYWDETTPTENRGNKYTYTTLKEDNLVKWGYAGVTLIRCFNPKGYEDTAAVFIVSVTNVSKQDIEIHTGKFVEGDMADADLYGYMGDTPLADAELTEINDPASFDDGEPVYEWSEAWRNGTKVLAPGEIVYFFVCPVFHVNEYLGINDIWSADMRFHICGTDPADFWYRDYSLYLEILDGGESLADPTSEADEPWNDPTSEADEPWTTGQADPRDPLYVDDDIFYINDIILGMMYDDLKAYLGQLPVLDSWEWDERYTGYCDLLFNGNWYTLFFDGEMLAAVRYEVVDDGIGKKRLTQYQAMFGDPTQRCYPNTTVEIPADENGFGYQYYTDSGLLSVFYNEYDGVMHVATQYEFWG